MAVRAIMSVIAQTLLGALCLIGLVITLFSIIGVLMLAQHSLRKIGEQQSQKIMEIACAVFVIALAISTCYAVGSLVGALVLRWR